MASTPTVSPAATSAATTASDATDATDATSPETYTDGGLTTNDGLPPAFKWTESNKSGKPGWVCNVNTVSWQNKNAWVVTVQLPDKERDRPRFCPAKHGGTVGTAFEAACAYRRGVVDVKIESSAVEFDPETRRITVRYCKHTSCGPRNLCIKKFAPDPHNNDPKDFEEFKRHYYVAVDPKSSQGERDEALAALGRLRTAKCHECRQAWIRCRTEGRGREARFYQMRVKINEYLKTRACVDCGKTGSEVPLECDHVTGTKTASVLDENAWSRIPGKTPQDMWDECIHHTVPRCKSCHLLRDNHAKEKAKQNAKQSGKKRPRTDEKNRIDCDWKQKRVKCFYCSRLVREGEEIVFHWMHSKKRMIVDRLAAGKPPLKWEFTIGSSRAHECEPVERWRARAEKEIAKCELGCANCHEMYETVPERQEQKDAYLKFIGDEAVPSSDAYMPLPDKVLEEALPKFIADEAGPSADAHMPLSDEVLEEAETWADHEAFAVEIETRLA